MNLREGENELGKNFKYWIRVVEIKLKSEINDFGISFTE